MKNKPFSIVVMAAAAMNCVLMYIFLLVYGGTRQTFGSFVLLLTAACAPSVILSVVALAARFTKLANWFFCISSLVVFGLGLVFVGSCAFDGGDMRGLGLVFIPLFQFLGFLVPLICVVIAYFITYLLQKKQPPQIE